jgi:hypothetical protein
MSDSALKSANDLNGRVGIKRSSHPIWSMAVGRNLRKLHFLTQKEMRGMIESRKDVGSKPQEDFFKKPFD